MKPKLNAFPKLIYQYYLLLQRYSRRITRDEEAAEDIAYRVLMQWSHDYEGRYDLPQQRQTLKKLALRQCRQWLLNEALTFRGRSA